MNEPINYEAELRKLYQARTANTQSLTDRLSEMEKYGSQVTDRVVNDITDPAARPAGYNPVNSIGAAINMQTGRQRRETAARTDVSNEQALALQTLMQLMGLDQFNQQMEYNYAKEGISINPTTGKPEANPGSSADSVVDAYVEQINNGAMNINNVPSDRRDAVITRMKALGINPKLAEKQRAAEEVRNIINQARDLYGYGNEVEDDDLSKGRLGGTWGNLLAALGMNDTVTGYNKFKKGITSTLRALVKETGVLTDKDMQRIEGLLPSTTATPGEAKIAFEEIEKLLSASLPSNDMADMGDNASDFDYAAAKAAGYSDEEIDAFLRSNNGK